MRDSAFEKKLLGLTAQLSGYQLTDYLLQPGVKMNLCRQLALAPFLFLALLLGNGLAATPLNIKDVIALCESIDEISR
ncbi:MAG TPA: hypothetical protein VIH18_15005 [Candidatus Binatia bacterium]